MQLKSSVLAVGLLGLSVVSGYVSEQGAQKPAPPPPEPAGQPGAAAPQQPAGRGRGQGRGTGPGTFPAQQRPPGDPALIERGKIVYAAACSSCHGGDLRGGQLGGPNLL